MIADAGYESPDPEIHGTRTSEGLESTSHNQDEHYDAGLFDEAVIEGAENLPCLRIAPGNKPSNHRAKEYERGDDYVGIGDSPLVHFLERKVVFAFASEVVCGSGGLHRCCGCGGSLGLVRSLVSAGTCRCGCGVALVV